MKNIFSGPRSLKLPVLGLALLAPVILRAQSSSPSLINFNVENYPLVDNPWGGVDTTTGELKVIVGAQMQVSDSGTVQRINFSPSVAVGDLNGDGLPDLVVADTVGYIWYYPNSGTKAHAVFTNGEVIPIWLGSTDLTNSHQAVVPRIQLIDYNKDGKLDLVVGTFDGSLFLLPNTGSPTQPEFRQPQNLDDLRIATRKEGVLWCNFLAPCLYDWSGKGLLDLVMGEGTYSANSIYLLRNQGTNDRPIFNEAHTLRMIPGMGREHLTPRIVDWNGDGKPDVITGEREGYLDLFLNTSTDPENPTFAPATHIKLGSQEQFGQLTSVNVVDLGGNGLPNLVVSSTDGRMLYATNTGKLGSPVFATNAVPLKGKNPYPKIYLPSDWSLGTPYGNSYELLVATSSDVEPGFVPPPDHKGKFALRAYVMDFKNNWFKTRYFVDPSKEVIQNEHMITYHGLVSLIAGQQYVVKFSVKTGGDVENERVYAWENQATPKGPAHISIVRPFSSSTSWDSVNESLSWESQTTKSDDLGRFNFSFRWNGTGSIYIDDVTLKKSD